MSSPESISVVTGPVDTFYVSHEDRRKVEKQLRREDANRYFGLAIAYTPESVFEDLERPLFGFLPHRTEELMRQRYIERYNRDPAAHSLIYHGLRDVGFMVEHIADVHPGNLSLDALIRIATHPHTIDSIALTASQTTATSSHMLRRPEAHYSLSPTVDSLWALSNVMPEPFGPACPASDLRQEGSKPSPLFNKVATWAAELSARALYHTRNSDDQTA